MDNIAVFLFIEVENKILLLSSEGGDLSSFLV